MSPEKAHNGRYEILGLIGAGGMGEVHRARDTTLDRIVALKLISEKLLDDPLAVRRFQREARSASALNHPHICTIYDVGDWDGRPFIAMEYLEGESLRRRLDRGPLQLEELVRFAIDIAEALEAAHSQEIVHRDIKPANLFVTRQADVKILDFGLAKRTVTKAKSKLAGGDETEAADINALSHSGSVGGTVSYMSPEQARGEKVDSRSDLFSFGLVLYEMATGKPAFDGDTEATIFAALLTAQPKPASERNPAVPRRLDEIISKALEKDRELRYQHASDMRADLKRLLRFIGSDPQVALLHARISAARHLRRKWMFWTAALFLSCVAAAVFFLRSADVRPANLKPRQITNYSNEKPVSAACISPDGKYLSYQTVGEINIRLIATGDVRTLKRPASLADQDEWWPVGWSPDGTRLIADSIGARPSGFKSGIWSVSVLTGAATELRQGALASALSRDGSQIAMLTGGNYLNSEIWVMGSQGEDARRIAAIANNENSYYSRADWLPSGQRILVAKTHQSPSGSELSVESLDLNGGKPVIAIRDRSNLVGFRLLPDGRMLYLSREPPPNAGDTNLWITATDPKSGAPAGQPRRLSDLAGFSMSGLNVSADGKTATLLKYSGHVSVFVGSLHEGRLAQPPKRLTLDDDFDYPWDWSADGKSIIFVRLSADFTGGSIYRQAIDSEEAELIYRDKDHNPSPLRTAPDGKSLLYMDFAQGAAFASTIKRIPYAGGVPQVAMKGKFEELCCPRAPAKECVMEELDDEHHQSVFEAYNVQDNTTRKLFTLPLPNSDSLWNISPDGSRLAMLQPSLHNGTIQIRLLNGILEREIKVKGWTDFEGVDWAADGKSLVLGAGNLNVALSHKAGALLRTDLQGNVKLLWSRTGASYSWAIHSPDGKKLAMLDDVDNRNVWLFEGF